jgi:hypothetical protein
MFFLIFSSNLLNPCRLRLIQSSLKCACGVLLRHFCTFAMRLPWLESENMANKGGGRGILIFSPTPRQVSVNSFLTSKLSLDEAENLVARFVMASMLGSLSRD